MERLKWIDSTGGPLVLISDNSYKLWSGIQKRTSYLENKLEDADDFMNPNETDYGKACSIQDYLGKVTVGDDYALVFDDEPLMTTVLNTTDNQVIVARWVYGDNEGFVDDCLKELDTTKIKNWQLSLTFELSSDKQYLFDSASDGSMLDKDGQAYLHLNILQGQHSIWTSIYEPDDKTKLLIHKFERTN